MPTTPEGLHYLDDGRELLALLRNWGPRVTIEFIDLDGPAKLVRSRPPGKSCYASQEAFQQAQCGLTPQQDGWKLA